MKSICFTLLLLLVAFCCTDAHTHGASFSAAPENCCFKMYNQALRRAAVASIHKTHTSCSPPAFIVTTVGKHQICYSRSFLWAQNTYRRLHNIEGSAQ